MRNSIHTAIRSARSAGRRSQFFVFLLLAAVVRLYHISLLPSLVTGMNPGVASSAKLLIQHGLWNADLRFPPLPTVLLAVAASVFDVPPGSLMSGFVLICSLLYAVSFWFWIDSLCAARLYTLFSCLAFLFLPFHNGYDGLDSVQTLLAGTIFLSVAAIHNNYLRSPNRTLLLLAAILASLLPLTRSEYCILVPLYFVLMSIGSIGDSGLAPIRRRLIACSGIMGGLAVGALSWMSFRYVNFGEFAIVSPDYACWTFLDGMPASWLSPNDNSEFARRAVGIERFGHPSTYSYSLTSMILANPGSTAAKFLLNIPRWLFELGGRSQVLPWPAALLAVLGLAMLLRRPYRRRRMRLAVQVLSMILMTAPMAGIMLYAEYLRPAYPAMCLLMGYGAAGVTVIVQRICRPISRMICFWCLALTLCAGMEFLYFHSGANYPDMPVLSRIGKLLDRLVDEDSPRRLLLDPWSSEVDSSCRANFWNRDIEREYFKRHGHSTTEPPAPIDVFELYDKIGNGKPAGVVVWGEQGDRSKFGQALARWRRAGFHVVKIRRVARGLAGNWSVAYCVKKDGSTANKGGRLSPSTR